MNPGALVSGFFVCVYEKCFVISQYLFIETISKCLNENPSFNWLGFFVLNNCLYLGMETATKWKERAKNDRANREMIRENQKETLKQLEENENLL